MNEDQEFINHLLDLLGERENITYKRMFGGYGLFCESVMFGLISENTLYLKVDSENIETFLTEGLESFIYFKGNKPVKLSYYEAPEAALEDPEVMKRWSELSINAAFRTAAKKRKKQAVSPTLEIVARKSSN